MKKLISLLLLSLLMTSAVYPQVKVKFKLMNPGIDGQGKYYLKLVAVVQPGQIWRVGSSNIRIDFRTVPATNVLTVFPDSVAGSVQEPLACINSGNYSGMTTTAISGRTAISLNIARLSACCTLSAGTYVLGRLRFTKGVDTTGCTIDTIRWTGSGPSVVQDSVTPLVHGTGWADSNFSTCMLITETGVSQGPLPTVFKLHDNYPNPFNPSTTIKYDIPRSSHVRITIYDMLGKEVGILVNQDKTAGFYEIKWDARNYASGAYIYKMETDSYTEIKKMMLIK